MKSLKSVVALLFIVVLVPCTVSVAAESITVTSFGGAFSTSQIEAYQKPFSAKTGVKVELLGGGATRGIRDAATMKVDMGGSCRMNLPGIDRSELYASLHPVAWDALAIIINRKNPINNITTEQIMSMIESSLVD